MAPAAYNLPASDLGFSRRKVFQDAWFDPAEEHKDPLAQLKERFAEFTERLSNADELARKHVYENSALTLLDVRQHRWMLHYLLYKAEGLAISFLVLQRPEETSSFVAFLDEQIARLRKTFTEWHGDPESAADVPDSFKESMRELATGQGTDMEEDLFAENAAAKA